MVVKTKEAILYVFDNDNWILPLIKKKINENHSN